MPLITLTTDFGLTDAYAGTLKGVILGICPLARVVDLTHTIDPGDVQSAAFALLSAAPFFPPKTIHVAVVDPGVGSARAALAIHTPKALLVGPDNGIFEPLLRNTTVLDCRRIENPALCLPELSRTFHGRDVFAPVAAHLARGVALSKVGPRWPHRVELPWPQPKRTAGCVQGEVLHIDRFGNAITNLPNAWFDPDQHHTARARAGKARSIPLGPCYTSVPPASAVAIPGSTGFLEIALHGGSASTRLGLRPRSRVSVTL